MVNVVTAKDVILNNTTLKTDTPNFGNSSCTAGSNPDGDCDEATVGLYCWDVSTNKQCTSSSASTNKTYFFRGDVTNNYVKFAGFYWRIIRINENGSIRMIYNGKVSDVDSAGKTTVLANGYDDSETGITTLGEFRFNPDTSPKYYLVGFMYGGSDFGNEYKSTILKSKLEPWYKTYIYDKGYDGYIDKQSGFCGDRTAYSNSDGTDTAFWWPSNDEQIYFGAYVRIETNSQPIFSCPDEDDLYTTSESSTGNNALTYPIGLITADEALFAGGNKYKGFNTIYNESYYLYNANYYWTITPEVFNPSGYLIEGPMNYVILSGQVGDNLGSVTDLKRHVRPVINLTPDVKLSGAGTIASPYTVS